MIEINEGLYEALLLTSNLTVEQIESLNLQQAISNKPPLKPNPNLGEGSATKDELSYRQQIINLLKSVINKFTEFKDSKIVVTQQLSQLDKLIETYITSFQQLVQKTVLERYQSGYTDMNTHLKKAGVTPPQQNPLQPRVQSILRQQLQNCEDIGLRLRGRLRQIINLKDIRSYYTQKPVNLKEYLTDDEGDYYIDPKTKKKVYIDNWDDDTDSAVNDAQNNSDMLGLYGWIESYNSGFLESGLFATAMLNSSIALTIQLPWETQGDENVCPECDQLSDEGPYSIWDWPAYPHFGCRCYPGDPIISFTGMISNPVSADGDD
jgi:hypothetical protein